MKEHYAGASPFSLDGKIVIVTGGTGHLGKEISKGMAAAGAIVYALGRNSEKLAALDACNSAFREKRIWTVSVDVTNPQEFAAFTDKVFQTHGKISSLVNNANANRMRQSWDELDQAGWNDGLEETLSHVFTCSKAVSAHMRKAGNGTIISTASVLSFLGPCFPMHLDLKNAAAVHHVVAKGGVLQLTRYLAAYLGADGIRVNAVAPGYFPQKRGPERPDYLRELCLRIPMKRIGSPPDISGAYVFLASDESSYVNGHNLVVDGGYSVW